MIVYGVLLLLLLLIYLVKEYIDHGIYFVLNIGKAAFIIWLFVAGLYNLKLCRFYHPNIEIEVIIIFVCINFYCVSKISFNNLNNIINLSENLHRNITATNKCAIRYYRYVKILFASGAFSFAITRLTHGFTLLNKNKIIRTELSFGYLYNSLVVCGIYFYIIFRTKKLKRGGTSAFILFFSSLTMLVFLLNRGTVAFILTGIVFYEFLKYCAKTKQMYLSKKMILFLVVLVFVGLIGFGYFGELRFKEVLSYAYHTTLVDFYGLSKDMPSGLGQFYVYLTSPIDNMANVFVNQKVNSYMWFTNLFYPFIKVISSIFGFNKNFSNYMNLMYNITPYLKPIAGLNVMSFLADAYQDLGYFGIIIYVLCYDFIIYLANKVLKSGLLPISKLLIYNFMFHMILWSVFTNSVFRLATLWVNIFFVFIIDFFSRKVRLKH